MPWSPCMCTWRPKAVLQGLFICWLLPFGIAALPYAGAPIDTGTSPVAPDTAHIQHHSNAWIQFSTAVHFCAPCSSELCSIYATTLLSMVL